MKPYSNLLNILLLICLSISLLVAEEAVVSVRDQNQMGEDVVLVEYDGGTITRKDLDHRISKIPPNQQGRFRTIEGQIQVLDLMALEDVLMKKAIEMGIDNDEEVDQRIDAGRRQFLIQEYYKVNVSDKVELTEADKQAFFEENPELFVMLPVININYINPSNEEQAREALAELKDGVSWENVSNAFSMNNYVKGLKGVINNIRLNGNIPGIGTDTELEQIIEANVDNLNQIIGPVQTPTGWHIFMITDYRPRYDKTYNEVMPEIEQRLRPVVERRILDEMRERLLLKYGVTIHDEVIKQIDLNIIEKNEEVLSAIAIEAPIPELTFTVGRIMESFNKLSPQEQIFYIKEKVPDKWWNKS